MQWQSVAGSAGYARWTAANNLGAESVGGVSPLGSRRRLRTAEKRDLSELQWRVGRGRRAE